MVSKLPRLLDTASKFALFSVSGFKDEKFKIDLYNSELYRFKVGAFFDTRCSNVYLHHNSVVLK